MSEKIKDQELIEKIRDMKAELGKKLIILTHHYQRKEIVDLGDFKGDSFGLSQKAAADKNAQYIIFCGVHFMAESAEILSRPHQIVQIPAMEAGCPMADMANKKQVDKAWQELIEITGKESVMPIVYMNSDAEIKAFCGRKGGAVCTSSNAAVALKWAFEQRDKVLFFPDQHLGRNSGNQMGIAKEEMIVWNPEKPLGGNAPEDIQQAKLILWDGFCSVHTHFTVDHVQQMRKKNPDAKIVVHPECTEDVVDLADAVGSTSYIVKYVEKAPADGTVIIGTEINLINRLSLEYPDKKVLDLHNSLCTDMFKINLQNLMTCLEQIGQFNVITVPEDIKTDARKALDRMLALAA